MNTSSSASASRPVDPAARATTLAIWTSVGSALLLATAGYCALDASRSESTLAGVGYLLAIVVAVPAAIGIVLAASALSRRSTDPESAVKRGTVGVVVVGSIFAIAAVTYLPALSMTLTG